MSGCANKRSWVAASANIVVAFLLIRTFLALIFFASLFHFQPLFTYYIQMRPCTINELMKGLYLSFNAPQCHMRDDIILSLMDARSSGEVLGIQLMMT